MSTATIEKTSIDGLKTMSISIIAGLIYSDWKNVFYGAKPYLQAMLEIENIGDMYFADTAQSVVLYFLSNATTWRGDVARQVKAELKARCK
jgi:hypothetical protein